MPNDTANADLMSTAAGGRPPKTIIRAINVRAVLVPLRRPVIAGIGRFDTWPLVLVNIETSVVLPTTYVNDVRFDFRVGKEGTAYITDSSLKGPGGLIVVDLASGISTPSRPAANCGRAWRAGSPTITTTGLIPPLPVEPRQRHMGKSAHQIMGGMPPMI